MAIQKNLRIGHATGLPIYRGGTVIGRSTGLPVGRSGDESYESYVASLGPLLWLAMTGTGATEVNKGTQGATLDGTITNISAQGIAGKIAADSAHLYNANNSVITVPNDASIQPDALGAFTWVAVCNPFSLGGGSRGRLATFPTAGADYEWRIELQDARMRFNVDAATDGFRQVDFSNRFVGKWTVFFATYDDSGTRIPDHYRYDAAGFEQAASLVSNAAVGALVTPNNTFRVGNISGGTRAFPGLKDEFLVFGSVLTEATMESIGRLALARRWSSYSQKLLEMA